MDPKHGTGLLLSKSFPEPSKGIPLSTCKTQQKTQVFQSECFFCGKKGNRGYLLRRGYRGIARHGKLQDRGHTYRR